jgi:hypothetical protein
MREYQMSFAVLEDTAAPSPPREDEVIPPDAYQSIGATKGQDGNGPVEGVMRFLHGI